MLAKNLFSAVLLFSLLSLSVSSYSENENLYQVTGVNTHFNGHDKPFDQYVLETQLMLSTYGSQMVAIENAPFQWPKDAAQKSFKKGVLLVHGLLGTAYEMRDMARFFADQGFLVRTILLPGHGTVPGDLLKVRHSDWIEAVDYGIESLSKEVDSVYVAGFSTGGGLAVHAAFRYENIKGLVLFAPAIKIASNLDFAAPYVKWIKKWMRKLPEEDVNKYESMPYNAPAQVYQLTQEIKSFSKKKILTTPIFMALSDDDVILSTEASERFFYQQKNSHNQLVLYTRKDAASLPSTNSKILSFAHSSLHVSNDNPQYGENGRYVDCLHYKISSESWNACKRGEGALGEKTKDILKNTKVLMRLSYNPLFTSLTKDITKFLDNIQ